MVMRVYQGDGIHAFFFSIQPAVRRKKRKKGINMSLHAGHLLPEKISSSLMCSKTPSSNNNRLPAADLCESLFCL